MLRSRIGSLVLIGVSAAALGGCGGPEADSAGAPAFVTPSATPTFAAPGGAASPSTPAVPSAPAPATSTAPPSTPAKASAVTYAFPVVGKNSYARVHHDYPATDVITACGNKVVAVTSGTITYVVRKDTWNPKVNAGNTRGGLSVAILGDDGVRYYGSHLSAIDPAIQVGVRVTTGQTLGRTGDTGHASACHLHFGISPPCAGGSDWWTQRGAIWPWPYLDSWRKGGNKSPVAEINAWKTKNGCPAKPRVNP
ncbi:peptidase M23-like protein [Krasilnikovia cinnamomea]|uniref:Peptidase M23-like protein n=1 Tax=Krasilnikovia cinnamomea TaxID=349313 RepID=A0A4Q7ZEN5_9ACTN|nr:M23 family metallopeptidase [Krasilnikovia cinnamomea]RZU49190.1 peptidase M23-like protein [Krasilnikovia cinnamomea]